MRILVIHNQYQQAGGEDSVFRAEIDLLASRGNVVESLLFDNKDIKTVFDKALSGLFSFYNPLSARRLKNTILRFQPELIHVHNFQPIASPALFFVAKRMKVPILLTLHNYRLLCPSATLFFDGKVYERKRHSLFSWDAIWKGVYRNSKIQTAVAMLITLIHHFIGTWRNKVDLYITLTNFAKQKFIVSSLAIEEAKFVVKPNFVKDFGNGLSKREGNFLFIGRLVEEKGIHLLLAAVADQGFKLIVIGDGPLQGLVQEASKANSNIQYIGKQTQAIVVEHLKKCQALIFPSIWYEGFPVTILEAFSTGTPVIASDMGGMKEIIQHEQNGLLFKPGDKTDLRLKIEQIKTRPDLNKQISANARLSYLEKYTSDKNYEHLMKIYNQALDRV